MTPTRIVVVVLAILLIVAVVVAFIRPSTSDKDTVDLNTFISDLRDNQVQKIDVHGNRVDVRLKDGATYSTRKEQSSSVLALVTSAGVDPTTIVIEVHEERVGPLELVFAFLPILLIIAAAVYITRRLTRKA